MHIALKFVGILTPSGQNKYFDWVEYSFQPLVSDRNTFENHLNCQYRSVQAFNEYIFESILVLCPS